MADPLVLGVDIGSTSIKILMLEKHGTTYVAKDLIIEPISGLDPEGGVFSSKVEEWVPDWENIAEILFKIVRDHGFKNQRAAFALQGKTVAPRFFSFPQMPLDNLKNAINFEAQETVPFPISESKIDFEIFPNSNDPNFEKLEGIFVAGMESAVDTLKNLALDVGLEPVIIDSASVAVINAFLEAGEGHVEKNTLLINIGNRVTNLIVVTPEGRIFVRDIAGGGADVTTAISNFYQYDLREAERFKTGGQFGQPNSQENISKLFKDQTSLIEDGFYNLIMQIRDTLRYFIAQRYISILDEIHITGGSAMFPGIIDFIGENLELPAIGWNVLFDISMQNLPIHKNKSFIETVGPMFGVAAGLAMRRDIK